MNPFVAALIFIIENLAAAFLFLVVLRFFLQLVRADFYNPFSQGIVKITNPALIPLRRIIPGVFGIDFASILLALIVQFVIGELLFFLVTQSFYNPLLTLLFAVLGTLKLTIYASIGIILVLVVSSFVAPFSQHPIILLSRQLLEPIMRPIQRILPPMGGLDLSVFFIGLGIGAVNILLEATAVQLQLVYPPLTYLTIGF